MRILLTNLSDKNYSGSRKKLNESAAQFRISEILSYDFLEIKNSDFYHNNKGILDRPKGLGYWLWKPYIILEAMNRLAEGDIVIYSDCGIEIIESLDPLINICKTKESILLFRNGNFSNSIWTKRDCFTLMECDNEKFWNGPHCDAAFVVFKKCELSIKFLIDWLRYGEDERIITDIPNTCGLPNLPDFIEHRWDQSILSLLAQKFNLHSYRMPTQFGNHYKVSAIRTKGEFNCVNQLNYNTVDYYSISPYYNSNYGQLLNHHREKSYYEPLGVNPGLNEIEKPVSVGRSQTRRVLKSLAAKMANKLKNI